MTTTSDDETATAPLDPRRLRMRGLVDIGEHIKQIAAEIEKRYPGQAATLTGIGLSLAAIGEMHDGFVAPANLRRRAKRAAGKGGAA